MKGTTALSIHFGLLLVVSSQWQTAVRGQGSIILGYDCGAEEQEDTCFVPDFCSQDGVCHPRNCETFYRYAQESLTGRGNQPRVGEQQQETEPQEKGEEELECYVNEFPPNNVVEPPCPPNENGGGLFPIAVYHTCRDDYGPAAPFGLRCWDWYNDAVHHSAGGQTTTGATTPARRFATMNRVCTAKPNPEQRFICYDIAPETDLESYFDNYLAAVESMGGCGNEQENSTSINNNNNDDDVTNSTTAALGHVVLDVHYQVGEGRNDASRNGDGTFDPILVAGLSVSTLLIDEEPESSMSLPYLSTSGAVSTIVIAIMIVVSVSSHDDHL